MKSKKKQRKNYVILAVIYIIVIALFKRKKIRCGILKIRKKLLSKRMDNSKEKQVRKNYLI